MTVTTGYFEDYHVRETRTTLGRTITEADIVLHAGQINPVAFSYGYDRIRFVRPVFIGDTIHVDTSITEKRDDPKRPNQGFVYELCTTTNQREEVVLAFTHIYAVERKRR